MKEAEPKATRPLGRREEILQEALNALSEETYDKISLRDIAKRLSISLGNLQYYFPTKDDLLFSACERTLAIYDGKAVEMEASQPDGIEGILQAFDWFIEEFNRQDKVVWLFLAQIATFSPRFKALRDESYSSGRNTWQKIIESSGLPIPDDKVAALAASILALIDGFSFRNFPVDFNRTEISLQLEALRSSVILLVRQCEDEKTSTP